MAWECTYAYPPTEPAVGSFYSLTVNKPAGWRKASVTGTGRETDPWIITYAAADPVQYPAVPADPADMSIRVANKPLREGYLKVVYGTKTTPTDRPIVRDRYSGGVSKPIDDNKLLFKFLTRLFGKKKVTSKKPKGAAKKSSRKPTR